MGFGDQGIGVFTACAAVGSLLEADRRFVELNQLGASFAVSWPGYCR
jgi:hypothetical protein